MVRYEQFGLGATWNVEYGTADDPEQLGWLLAYSPYHHVREGVAYPATLFTVFDGDTRVDPLHARKMCAALQHATAGDRPILLRREKDVGHGARSISRSVDLSADTLDLPGQAPGPLGGVSSEHERAGAGDRRGRPQPRAGGLTCTADGVPERCAAPVTRAQAAMPTRC